MALSKIDTTNMIEDVPQSKLDNNINFRNIIINGDMSIAQRGTSATGINTTSQYNTVDRFEMNVNGMGVFTQTQETDVPTGQGFAKSMKLDCTTADATPASSDYLIFRQKIEGQNLQYLKKGTSNAESLTCSFWVKSNKTGTYTCELNDIDNSRTISKSYTIDTANSLRLNFWLGAGSNYTSGTLQTSWATNVAANRAVGNVNLADSTSNEWYITGVQLEAGQTASEFEFLPVDVNFQRCLRYYQLLAEGNQIALAPATYYTSSQIYCNFTTKVPMRAAPTLDIVTGTNYYIAYRNGGGDNVDTFTLAKANNMGFELNNTTQASGTGGHSSFIRTANTSAYIAITAEL
jgi:hypothetical protein